MARILTLSLNPALDLALSLDCLIPGDVNRTRSSQLSAAGKGVNVARVLVSLGHDVSVSGFLGADNDGSFLRDFEALGVNNAFVRVPGETRINAKITEASGRVTDINGPGAAIDKTALQQLIDRLDALISAPGQRPQAVVMSGSLPPGITAQNQAELIRRIKEYGIPIWVDTSGDALASAIEAMPTGIKPNEQELANWAGEALDSDAKRLSAAQRLHAAGIEEAMISAGPEGVLWISRRGTWQATPPKVRVVSTVCAGDTLLAAMLHGVITGMAPEATLRFATALSAEAVRHIGVGDPQAEDFSMLQQQTRVRQLADAGADANTYGTLP